VSVLEQQKERNHPDRTNIRRIAREIKENVETHETGTLISVSNTPYFDPFFVS
jgi:hypothetical protein